MDSFPCIFLINYPMKEPLPELKMKYASYTYYLIDDNKLIIIFITTNFNISDRPVSQFMNMTHNMMKLEGAISFFINSFRILYSVCFDHIQLSSS